MPREHAHDGAVDAWCAAHRGLARAARLRAFEAAADALWARTRVTLGEVTVGAVIDRVLANTAARAPAFRGARLHLARGVDVEQARAELLALDDAALDDALRFFLVEFLTILGNLTADILTPDLHDALARAVAPADEDPTT